MKKLIFGVAIIFFIYSLASSCGGNSNGRNPNGNDNEIGYENKLGESIPLLFGGSYDSNEEPIQAFIDDWKLGDTSNYSKGGFAYPIGGWFQVSFMKGTFWESQCENCNEDVIIKLNKNGSGKMLTYTEVYNNRTSEIIASSYPSQSPNCLDEKVNWKYNKSTDELKITLVMGNQSNTCYAQLNALLDEPFKRNKSGVWISIDNIMFVRTGKSFGDLD